MSQLNYLEKLLDGVEVEWKALGEVCDFKNGFAFKSSLFKEAGLPIIRITNVDGKNISLDDVKYFDPSDYKENTASYEISKGDILIAMSGATTGKIGFYAHESPAYLNQRVGKFLPKPKILNNRYLYHYLLSKVEQIYVIAGGGAQPNLSSNALMAKIEIPIPCPDNPEKSLAIQAEIVRILDAFTAMTAELTAELNLRKKQYNYYRDQLLSFEEGEVEWKTLGEVALDFGRGKSKHRPRNDPSLYGGDIPFIQTGDIRNAAHTIQEYSQTYSELGLKQSKLWPKGTLCITIAANIAETSILGFDACFPDSVIGFVANPEKTSSSYVEYLLSSIKTQLEEKGQGSAQSNINLGTFQNLKLPFPPIAEQERIVSLLDKFELLTNSIADGLPREIELRQKQYEYYRDLLLSFPKSNEGVA
ncbi:TPA: restriction endonuclease subunit S [Vibrio parahaemolyticus]|nr:restriction endonuclease subunit S [Vibrio parahaemolyticus]